MTEKELIKIIENDYVKIGGSWILYEKGIIKYEDINNIDVYIRTDKGDDVKYANIKRLFDIGFRISEYGFGNFIEYMHRKDLKRFHIQFIYCSNEDTWKEISTVKYIYKKKSYRINQELYYNNIEQRERDILHCRAIKIFKSK